MRKRHIAKYFYVVFSSSYFFSVYHITFIAIGNSHPELLSQCSNGVLSEPLNVTDQSVYDFVYDLYDEIAYLFTDDYIHLGGDEGRRNTVVMCSSSTVI